ncbi:hypothetical protein M9H77_26028 [Catharanthus roseus]|uniref:Uncharacterized protein n=1 Tax=Catharanthus roseus TaxID=4058 RepID=A0ACC0A8M1_CATRO|nr:hypothetical protein M9H77_26028 [Catharanthus roseus]
MSILEEVKMLKKEEAAEEELEKEKECHLDERRFKEIFTKGEVLKRHDDRNVNKLDDYGRLLHHMISNIIIPNVGHKLSITNMHSFVMLALHEYRRMNFGFMAIEHMLATQSSSTKCLPYSCFLTKIFQYFVLNLVGVSDPIGAGKIYSKHTFKRMGFEKNEKGMLVRGGHDKSDEDNEDDEGNEEQKAMDVDEEDSETELEEETHRREIRQKKIQERAKEGSSSGSMNQIMDMIVSLQASMNKEQKMHKRSLKGNLHRSKRSYKTTIVYEDEVIKLNTLKTRRLVRGVLKVTL